MAKYLYGASVQGIQEFIFQTKKLKEIGGASELVEEICKHKFKEHAGIEDNDENIIINAAGNIKYIFENEDKCKAFVRTFPMKIADFAPGITISQAVVELEENSKLTEKIDELEKNLRIQRNKAQNPTEIRYMGIERFRRTDGLSVVINDENIKDYEDYIDAATYQKSKKSNEIKQLKKDENKNEKRDGLYYKFLGNGINYDAIPLEMEDITKDSKSWLAVIHADGNGLGTLLHKLSESLKGKTNDEVKLAFKDFSKKLDNATQEAAQSAFKEICTDSGKFSNKNKYPLRPIILGGDDITLIIRADLALEFTQHFLKKFEENTKNELRFLQQYGVKDFGNGLTACAGIAYIKDHYPMHYALDLAEKLTKKAKDMSKNFGKDKNLTLPPSSLAFYKVHASFIEDMDEIVKKTLMAGEISFDYGPYYIDREIKINNENIPLNPNIETFNDKLKEIKKYQNDENKSTSKLRQWVSELFVDKNSADFMMKRMKSKNKKFYCELGLENAIENKKSMIYDLLEINSLSNVK
jgi:hypothetical protein